jgi:hypothetical protein
MPETPAGDRHRLATAIGVDIGEQPPIVSPEDLRPDLTK